MAQSGGTSAQGCGWLLAIGVGVLAIARCSGPTPAPDPASTPNTAPASTPGYVAARSLRCRIEPNATAIARESLTRTEQVMIIGRNRDWSKLSRLGGDCWVATAFLTDAAPAGGYSNTGQGVTSAGNNRQPGRLASGIAAAGASTAYAMHRTRAHRARSNARWARPSHPPRRSSGYSYGSNCPCAGRTVCIGPRGGRYCITSGGNKRYGI